jgi:hypothetical protein
VNERSTARHPVTDESLEIDVRPETYRRGLPSML